MSKKKVKIPACKKFEKECSKYWQCRYFEEHYNVCICKPNYMYYAMRSYYLRKIKEEKENG